MPVLSPFGDRVALAGQAQDDALATYAHKLNKEEARIDWTHPAVELERLIRAFHPWPICHASLEGAAVKIHAARIGAGQGRPGQIIAADKEVTHGRVIQIIDLVRSSGIFKFALNIDPVGAPQPVAPTP